MGKKGPFKRSKVRNRGYVSGKRLQLFGGRTARKQLPEGGAPIAVLLPNKERTKRNDEGKGAIPDNG